LRLKAEAAALALLAHLALGHPREDLKDIQECGHLVAELAHALINAVLLNEAGGS
jgi:hypothetical protein